jgi:hypothetical protein
MPKERKTYALPSPHRNPSFENRKGRGNLVFLTSTKFTSRPEKAGPVSNSGCSTAADPLETGGARVTPELLNVISPETNGQVKFYAVAYPPSPIDAPVEVSLEIWQDGQMVLQTPSSEVAPDPSGAASILASIPPEKLPSGQYEAQISFHYKRQKVSKVTTFAVGTGS